MNPTAISFLLHLYFVFAIAPKKKKNFQPILPHKTLVQTYNSLSSLSFVISFFVQFTSSIVHPNTENREHIFNFTFSLFPLPSCSHNATSTLYSFYNYIKKKKRPLYEQVNRQFQKEDCQHGHKCWHIFYQKKLQRWHIFPLRTAYKKYALSQAPI